MRKVIQFCGWLVWSLALIYAVLGIANGDKLEAMLRDSVIQKHGLWDAGTTKKEEAKVALFELSGQLAALHKRVYWTLGGLTALGTVMILSSRKNA